MHKTTLEEFIKRAKDNYPKYDYSVSQYNGIGIKVKAICPIHGEFEEWPDYFLHKNKFREPCKLCYLTNKNNQSGIKYTLKELLEKIKECTLEFTIENINELIENKDLTIYDCVLLKCKTCGLIIKKKIANIIYGIYHCKICKKLKKQLDLAIKKMNIFLENAKNIYPQYDYSLVKPCINKYELYIIICPIHGLQLIYPKSFYRTGCPRCDNPNIKYKGVNRLYTNDEFINELINIYGDEYDYSKVNYQNWKMKVLLKCQKHGEFLREPYRLIKEHRGCPHCLKSLLEKDIIEFLNKNNIKYIDLYHIGLKRLDFYLPEYNIAIECQGRQHFFLNSIFNTNIQTKEELYQIDLNKLQLAKKAGIKNILYFSNYIINDYFEKVYTKKDDLLKAIYSYEKRLL